MTTLEISKEVETLIEQFNDGEIDSVRFVNELYNERGDLTVSGIVYRLRDEIVNFSNASRAAGSLDIYHSIKDFLFQDNDFLKFLLDIEQEKEMKMNYLTKSGIC